MQGQLGLERTIASSACTARCSKIWQSYCRGPQAGAMCYPFYLASGAAQFAQHTWKENTPGMNVRPRIACRAWRSTSTQGMEARAKQGDSARQAPSARRRAQGRLLTSSGGPGPRLPGRDSALCTSDTSDRLTVEASGMISRSRGCGTCAAWCGVVRCNLVGCGAAWRGAAWRIVP